MKKITLLVFVILLLASFGLAQMPIFRGQFTTNVPGAYVRGASVFGDGLGTYSFTVNNPFTNLVGNAYFGGGTSYFQDGIEVRTGGSIFHDYITVSNYQHIIVDHLGGVDFMISTNLYGVGTTVPLFILRNGTFGINMDSQPTYSISASSYWANNMTADTFVYSPNHWFGTLGGLPRLSGLGVQGIGMYPQTGADNWWTWHDTNGAPVSVVHSNGWFGVQTLTPEAPIDVDGQVIATNFTLRVPQWDDVRVPMGALGSPSSQPGRPNFIGTIKAYAFDDASTEELHFELQLPHGLATNYPVDLHMHWSALVNSAGANSNVVWGLEYAYCNPFAIFPAGSTTIYITNGFNTARQQLISELFEVPPGSYVESALLIGRLFREGGNASDNYPEDAYGLSLDAHYPRVQMGSVDEDGDY